MKKKMKILLAAAVIVLAGAAGGMAYYIHTLQNSSVYLDQTFINGINMSGKTPARAAEILAEGFDEGRVSVMEDGEEVFQASLEELGYTVDHESLDTSLADILASEKTDLRVVLDGLMNGSSFEVTLPYKSDASVFEQAVRVDALSVPRKESRDAKILYYEEERVCRIRPEVQGTEIEEETLREWLRGEVEAMLAVQTGAAADGPTVYWSKDAEASSASGTPAGADTIPASGGAAGAEAIPIPGGASDAETTAAPGGAAGAETTSASGTAVSGQGGNRFDLVCTIPASLYIQPEEKASDEELQEKCEILNRYAGNSITYVFGGETETLEFKKFMNWLKIRNGEVSVREEKVRKYVKKLIDKYETRYHERVFMTTWGYEVVFSPDWNEYGYTILEEEEVQQLISDILSGESVEREPVYLTYDSWGCPLYYGRNGTDDLNGTYVEVNLSAQHMWYYLNGVLIVESDVVTGDVTKDMSTSTGVFPLAFKESPSILRGGEGKERYETEVQYWMPFYSGQGLHDASWKTVFGGTEYIGNGSHGCVNLPPWVAEVLYYNIVPGTAVILYW
ncbi:MAG: L,D-transpeptidase [Eubacteriales bacterium]|nr:L,D-transpeptidase [Eubacteriales bacterium]